MKKLIGCLLIFLLGVGSTLGYLAWRDREKSRDEPALGVEKALEVRDELVSRAKQARQRDGSSSLVVTETDLEALITSALAEHEHSQDLVRIVREVKTEIGQNSVEVGVSVDLDALERSGLADADALDRVLDALPFLRGRELYVGFRGAPGVDDGKIALVDDLEVTLGFLTLPVNALEDRLGFSAERLYSNLVFDVDWFVVEEVRAAEDELTLEVRPK